MPFGKMTRRFLLLDNEPYEEMANTAFALNWADVREQILNYTNTSDSARTINDYDLLINVYLLAV